MDVATERTNYGAVSRSSEDDPFDDDYDFKQKILEGKPFEIDDRLIWEDAEAAGSMTLLPEY